jgi:hypothetical protein
LYVHFQTLLLLIYYSFLFAKVKTGKSSYLGACCVR